MGHLREKKNLKNKIGGFTTQNMPSPIFCQHGVQK
jgi:ribosomal protein S17E